MPLTMPTGTLYWNPLRPVDDEKLVKNKIHQIPKHVLDQDLQLKRVSCGRERKCLPCRCSTRSPWVRGGRGSSHNSDSQVFLSYNVPRGIFNIFHKDTWITKKIFYIVFLLKNLLVAVPRTSENTDHIALCHCLVGTGFPRPRLTCAHPKSQTDLGMSLWPLG